MFVVGKSVDGDSLGVLWLWHSEEDCAFIRPSRCPQAEARC